MPWPPADSLIVSSPYGYAPSRASSREKAVFAADSTLAAGKPGRPTTRITVPLTVAWRVVASRDAVAMKSRTFAARNSAVRPSAERETWRPVVAHRSGTSEVSTTWTAGLDGVTNGSPWLGRANGVAREIHGIHR
ncbi:MAG: hypothetical protein U0838_09190 [Chloroflexota bacterium]